MVKNFSRFIDIFLSFCQKLTIFGVKNQQSQTDYYLINLINNFRVSIYDELKEPIGCLDTHGICHHAV